MHSVAQSRQAGSQRRWLHLGWTALIALLVVVLWAASSVPAAAQGTGLSINKVWGGGDTTCPGYTQHFDIYVTNNTGAAMTNVVVTDILPERSYFQPNSRTTPGYSYDPVNNRVTWPAITLNPGETRLYEILIYTNTTNTPGSTMTNRARATADGGLFAEDAETTTFVACPTAVEIGGFAAQQSGAALPVATVVGLGLVALGGLAVARRRVR